MHRSQSRESSNDYEAERKKARERRREGRKERNGSESRLARHRFPPKIIYREAIFRAIPSSRSLTVPSQLSYAFAPTSEIEIESVRVFQLARRFFFFNEKRCPEWRQRGSRVIFVAAGALMDSARRARYPTPRLLYGKMNACP